MNSAVEANKFNKHVEKNCIHTRNIYSLIDVPKKDEVYKKLNKHVESCGVCALELKNFEAKTLATQIFIPKALMDQDLKQSFERELDELFKVMNLNRRENLKNNVKKGLMFADRMGLDFIKNLASKQMLKAYVLALLVFACLKMVL